LVLWQDRLVCGFTLKDRMERQIEERVTRDIKIETRLARIEERIGTLKSEVWMQRSTTESK